MAFVVSASLSTTFDTQELKPFTRNASLSRAVLRKQKRLFWTGGVLRCNPPKGLPFLSTKVQSVDQAYAKSAIIDKMQPRKTACTDSQFKY